MRIGLGFEANNGLPTKAQNWVGTLYPKRQAELEGDALIETLQGMCAHLAEHPDLTAASVVPYYEFRSCAGRLPLVEIRLEVVCTEQGPVPDGIDWETLVVRMREQHPTWRCKGAGVWGARRWLAWVPGAAEFLPDIRLLREISP